jgi:hypothetical protein
MAERYNFFARIMNLLQFTFITLMDAFRFSDDEYLGNLYKHHHVDQACRVMGDDCFSSGGGLVDQS